MRKTFMSICVGLACIAEVCAVDEVSYTAGSKTVTLPGVVIDGRQYFDAELTLLNSTPLEFSVSRATAASAGGAVSFSSSTGRLTIPSLRYQDSSGTKRFGLELTLSSSNPLRFKISTATLNDQTYSDSTDAVKVAAWLRSAPPASNAASHFSVLGVQSFNGIGSVGEATLKAQGPTAFYQNSAALQDARSAITSRLSSFGPAMQAGGITTFRDVQNLPWGMIETSAGTYNYTLLDHLVQSYQAYGVDYVGVAMPFASWDLATRSAAAAVCTHFFNEDYAYLAAAGKMDRYVDVAAFASMLQKAVERYDGDGVSDMSGLVRPVKYWQIQNEPEGSVCGQFRNDVPAFFDLMKRSYIAVKAACADCQVINGGASVIDKTKAGGSFWYDYAALGGKDYQDIIAIHFNDGKDPGTQDVTELETRIANIKDALGSGKPIWVTEFGVAVNIPPGGFVSLTETQAASWFTRFYAAGMNGGVTRFFSDASSFISNGGSKNIKLLLPYYTNKLLEAKIGNFTASAKLAAGQYRFTVGGSPVYVLWSGVPAELTGTVTSYDIYGNETKGDASALKPSESLPLIVTK